MPGDGSRSQSRVRQLAGTLGSGPGTAANRWQARIGAVSRSHGALLRQRPGPSLGMQADNAGAVHTLRSQGTAVTNCSLKDIGPARDPLSVRAPDGPRHGLNPHTEVVQDAPKPISTRSKLCRQAASTPSRSRAGTGAGGIDHDCGPSMAGRLWRITVGTRHDPPDPDTARPYLLTTSSQC